MLRMTNQSLFVGFQKKLISDTYTNNYQFLLTGFPKKFINDTKTHFNIIKEDTFIVDWLFHGLKSIIILLLY